MKTKTAFLPVIALLLAGCATTPLNTVSGRPEVTVHAQSAAVRTVTVNYFVDLGFAPVQTDGNQLVFQKESPHGGKLLMGMLTDNPNSTDRITVTLIENADHVRVVGGVAAVGQTNFGGQRVVELSGKGYQQLQAALEVIKTRSEAR